MADEREAQSNEGQTLPPRPYGRNGALGDQPELDHLPPAVWPMHCATSGRRVCAPLQI